MMLEKAFSGRLKDVREAAGLTQSALAEKAGVSQATISELEAGQYAPEPATIAKLARGLGVLPTTMEPEFPESVYTLAERLGLDVSRFYPEGRVAYALVLDCSPADLDDDENPDDLDIVTFRSRAPIAEGTPWFEWPTALADLDITHYRTAAEVRGFVGHADIHSGRVPDDAQVAAIAAYLDTLK